MFDQPKVYLLRQDTGDREDYYPLAANLTLTGACEALADKAEERGLLTTGSLATADPADDQTWPTAEGLFITAMPLGA